MRRRLVLSAALLALVAADCTSAKPAASPPTTRPPPATSSVPAERLSGSVRMVFDDTAVRTTCPPASPAGAECFELSAANDVPPYGSVTLGPMLDVEAPQGSPACGSPAHYATSLSTVSGRLQVAESGPRLCLGVEGTFRRSFTVTGGTGAYAGSSGAGTIVLDVLSAGAQETWTGDIATHP